MLVAGMVYGHPDAELAGILAVDREQDVASLKKTIREAFNALTGGMVMGECDSELASHRAIQTVYRRY